MAIEYSMEQFKRRMGVSEADEAEVLEKLGITASEIGQSNAHDMLILMMTFIAKHCDVYIKKSKQLRDSDTDNSTPVARFEREHKLAELTDFQLCLGDILKTITVLDFIYIGECSSSVVVMGENETKDKLVFDNAT